MISRERILSVLSLRYGHTETTDERIGAEDMEMVSLRRLARWKDPKKEAIRARSEDMPSFERRGAEIWARRNTA